MKNVWIIYKKFLSEKVNAFSWMIEEGKKRGIEVEIKFFEGFEVFVDENLKIYYDGKVINVPDYVIIRGYDLDLSSAFEQMGTRVINTTESMELCLNKWRTHVVLAANNIPTPKSIKRKREELDFHELRKRFGGRFIVKILRGSKGEGVFLINHKDELTEVLREYDNDEFICQEFIHESFGQDIRVHVVGGKAVAGVRRLSSNGDFRANFSLGGRAEELSIDDDIKILAEKAAKAMGLEIAGVDILQGNGRNYICEVNGNAGFVTVWKTSNISLPGSIMNYVAQLPNTKDEVE